MNKYLNALNSEMNYGYTENGAIKHNTTNSKLLDLFAWGASYRNHSEDDIINLFKEAYLEDPTYALKCLFYIRDARGDGQGERRFFRTAYKWLCNNDSAAAARNLKYIPEFGRWDDILYITVDTPLEYIGFVEFANRLAKDYSSLTPSIAAKWAPSENTSSIETKRLAHKLRHYMHLSHKDYRHMLSTIRDRIHVLERLMSSNKWADIEFDKIPSKAGVIYKDAFARRDEIAEKYRYFMIDKNTKVNAKVLYPYEIAKRALKCNDSDYRSVERMTLQKYWDNLPDLYNGREENAIAVVDVSGSMWGQPLEVAVSLGAYVAERGKGPFANHFITFSDNPQLVRFNGVDIVDKLKRCVTAEWGGSTNIEAVCDLLLNTALKHHTSPLDMPNRLYILSDMEFNVCTTNMTHRCRNIDMMSTLFETTAKKWQRYGYKLPNIVFWNLDARNENIPAIGEGFSYVSGFSPNILKAILSGKTRIDLMYEMLNSKRYSMIQ